MGAPSTLPEREAVRVPVAWRGRAARPARAAPAARPLAVAQVAWPRGRGARPASAARPAAAAPEARPPAVEAWAARRAGAGARRALVAALRVREEASRALRAPA